MPFTDNFTDTDGVELQNHTPSGGGSWSIVGSAGAYICTISSNALIVSSGGGSGATVYTPTDQGSANQYVQYKQIFFLGATSDEVCCRFVDTSNYISHRLAGTGASGSRLSKVVAGVRTELVQVQGAVNDVIKIECSGTDVKLYINAVQQGTTQTVTDHQTETTHALYCGQLRNPWMDDYEAGALGGGTTVPVFMSNYLRQMGA